MGSVNILLTEIALNLLGNKFYDLDGKCVDNLYSLYQISNKKYSPSEKTLLQILGISETSFKAADNLQTDVIDLEGEEANTTEEAPADGEYILPGGGDVEAEMAEYQKEFASSHSDSFAKEDDGNLLVEQKSKNPKSRKRRRTNNSSIDQESKISATKNPLEEPGPSTSAGQTVLVKKEPADASAKASGNDTAYMSKDPRQRQNFMQESTAREFEKMRSDSYKARQQLIDTNDYKKMGTVIEKSHTQENLELIEESNALMQFIKFLKNDSTEFPAGILAQVASDILKAKDLLK